MSSKTIDVFKITAPEVEKAAQTLFEAFATDPLMIWVFGDKETYKVKGLALFKVCVNYCVLYGVALKTAEFEAVALRKAPGDEHTSFWRLIRSGMYKSPKILGKLGFQRLMQFERVMSLERKKQMGTQEYWYCWMVGTRPQYQQQGFGRALMEYTFQLANSTHLPCYLETSSKSSLQVHLHKGYEALSECLLEGSDVMITSMKKP